MAEVEATRFGDLCRLCATETNVVLSVNIFTNEGAIREIDKKIETCLPIHVHETDELPKMICEHCLCKLELFFEFRERTVRTETLLIDLYKELNGARVQNEPQIEKLPQMQVVEMGHSDLLLVQHQNLNQIELQHFQERNIIVDQEIILQHPNDITSHTIDGIDLNHELTRRDLPTNHSLDSNSLLVASSDSVHDIQNAQYAEGNIELMHESHILAENFQLQHNMPVGMEENVNIPLTERSSTDIKANLTFQDHFINMKDPLSKTTEPSTQEAIILTQTELNSDTQTSNILPPHDDELTHDQFATDSHSEAKESIKCEENNSENSLTVGAQLNDSSSDMFSMHSTKGEDGEKEWYYCNMCGKTFALKLYFEMHYEDHFNKCSVCLAVFTNRDALNQHRKEVHDTDVPANKPIKTRLKRATVPVKRQTKVETNSDSESMNEDAHDPLEEEDEDDPSVERSENGGKRRKWAPKVCTECGKSYKTNYKLNEHMRKHTGEKPYKCGSCEKAFRSKIGLAQHEAKHTGHYDYSCPTCGKGFQCKSYLMVHQRVHSDIKPYPCTTCGRNFKTKQSLLDHTNRHLGVKPYMCDICGRGFITKGLCKAHQKIHTGMDNRKYSCKVCNKMFVSKSYLQTHLRIHTGEKPFMCEVCGKGFLTRVDLRIHSTMHTGEKSYVCEMCGKAFARRDALRCHRRSHTGERPYSCDLCGQTFTQFSPMAIHKRLHTGERPYTCETCGKTFVSRSTMMSHAKKHVR